MGCETTIRAEPPRSVVFVYNTGRYLYNLRGDLIRSLISNGVRVMAIVPDDGSVGELEKLGAKVYEWNLSEHGVNPIQEWFSYRQLKMLMRKAEADVVFNFTVKPVIYGSAAAKRLGKERTFSMITGRGYLFGGQGLRRKILKALTFPLYKRSLRYNKGVFFQNNDDMGYFIRSGLVRHSQAIRIDGSGVDIDRFHPRPAEVRPGTFLLIARLLKEKGIFEYVDAARELKKIYPKARFQILGPFSAAPSAIKPEQIRQWHSEGVIEYLGETKDVVPYLASSMAFVLPSYYREGLPRTSLEALAMGKPVITTDWPGCREAVEDGRNGTLVAVKDPLALARAMGKFLEQPELAIEMGCRSRELAELRFDVRRVNATIMKRLLQ